MGENVICLYFCFILFFTQRTDGLGGGFGMEKNGKVFGYVCMYEFYGDNELLLWSGSGILALYREMNGLE